MSDYYVPAPAASRTGPLLFLAGGFDYGQAAVPYFSVSMSIHDLVSRVKLPNEVPFNMDTPVQIDELFQRERNEGRSKNEIARYLRKQDDLKFFNSITVALFPLRKDNATGRIQVASTYDDDEYFGDRPVGLDSHDIGVGQVTLYRFAKDKSQGFISWDDERTLPVVLDGQHRLASLKHVLATGQVFQGKHELEHSRLSVLLLVLDKRAGFSDPQDRSVMAACRTVFTDLNKHAQPVSRARQYLLDEGDVLASSLRNILAESVSTNPLGSVLQRAADTVRLPLALIDWRGEEAKFDKGPYVSTILAMYPVIESLVGIKVPALDDYEELPGYVSRLTSRLLEGSAAVDLRAKLIERINDSASKEIPFALLRSEVQILAEGFRKKFGKRVVGVLTGFAPYRRLIEAYSAAGLYNTELEAWFSLDASAREALVNELQVADPTPQVSLLASTVKGAADASKMDLSFQVVFQRALILAADLFVSFRESIAVELGINLVDDDLMLGEFIKRANDRLAPGLARGANSKAVSPFLGAGIRPDGTIDFRKTRTSGIAGFMLLAVLAPNSIFDLSLPVSSRDSVAENWVNEKWSLISRGVKTGIDKVYSSQGAAWRRGLLDVARAREIDESEIESGMVELAVAQLMGLADATNDGQDANA